jgi:hypothetical protein
VGCLQALCEINCGARSPQPIPAEVCRLQNRTAGVESLSKGEEGGEGWEGGGHRRMCAAAWEFRVRNMRPVHTVGLQIHLLSKFLRYCVSQPWCHFSTVLQLSSPPPRECVGSEMGWQALSVSKGEEGGEGLEFQKGFRWGLCNMRPVPYSRVCVPEWVTDGEVDALGINDGGASCEILSWVSTRRRPGTREGAPCSLVGGGKGWRKPAVCAYVCSCSGGGWRGRRVGGRRGRDGRGVGMADGARAPPGCV